MTDVPDRNVVQGTTPQWWGIMNKVITFIAAALATTTGYAITANSHSVIANHSNSQAVSCLQTAPTLLSWIEHWEFKLGGYTFNVGHNGTGYTTAQNGTTTANLGFTLFFSVSDGTATKPISFGWAPPSPKSGTLPAPPTASLFEGDLRLAWLANDTGTYLQVTAC